MPILSIQRNDSLYKVDVMECDVHARGCHRHIKVCDSSEELVNLLLRSDISSDYVLAQIHRSVGVIKFDPEELVHESKLVQV